MGVSRGQAVTVVVLLPRGGARQRAKRLAMVLGDSAIIEGDAGMTIAFDDGGDEFVWAMRNVGIEVQT